MSGLTDYVDRLSTLAAAIRSNAFSTGRLSGDGPQPVLSSAGPFTRAVLDAPLGDLIRDIDPSELGLFTIVQPPSHSALQTTQEDSHGQKAEIARVALPIATPLRRPPAATHPRREDGQRHGEYDPEVYANAALKFLGRYQSIRHMPRYSEEAEMIIDRLDTVRKNISSLNEKLKQASSSSSNETHVSPKAKILEEERRIQEAEVQMLELRRRKEVLLHKQKRIQSKSTPGQRPESQLQSPSRSDTQEENFWNTPGAAARTLHFADDLLTDEEMDMGDMSALASPISEQVPNRAALRPIPRAVSSKSKTLQFTRKPYGGDSIDMDAREKKLATPSIEYAEADEDEDKTVMLDKLPQASPHATSMVRAQLPTSVEPTHVSQTSVESDTATARDTEHSVASRAPDGDRRTKLKVTVDVERIIEKIWATIGDLIMPGHTFDVSGTGSGAKPPHAKETISHLRSVAALTPSLASPASSISYSTLSTVPTLLSGPTPQQILTTQMLLAMLASPPSYSMPLNKLKEILSASGMQGSAVTRPIYGCVAKRLLKIERGGGEQVVRFDV